MALQKQTITGIPYSAPDGMPLLLDLYLPQNEDGPHPVILYIHGGGWYTGSRAKPVCLSFVDYGYAVVSIDYRLSGVATFPAQIIDCRNALRWVRANASNYNIDPNRTVAWGVSAGGHLASLLATSASFAEWDDAQIEPIQAVIDFFGPTEFHTKERSSPDSPEARLFGGAIADNLETARAASPITYISPECPPFLIVHGDADDVVQVEQSQILHQALQRAEVSSTLHIVPGGRHGFKPEQRAKVMQVVENFLLAF